MAVDFALKRARDKAYRESNREELNAKARARMAAYYKTEAYKKYLEASKDSRRKRKEKYRRAAGVLPRGSIGSKRAAAAAEKRKAREEFLTSFVGPPKPTRKSYGVAAYQRWLYRSNQRVREYQKAKRSKQVASVTYAYAREQLHMVGAPHELIVANQMKLLIKRDLVVFNSTIKEVCDVNQRGN